MTAYPLTWPAGWKRTLAEYMISEDGRVFRKRDGILREMAQHPDEDGYLCVQVFVAPGKRRSLRVHRAVCSTFHGEKPGFIVRHLDDNKRNNHKDNLAWGTVSDNSKDAMRNGRVAKGLRNGAYTKPEKRRRGIENGNSKLTPESVIRILKDVRSQSAIARDYGVNQTLVSHIKIGRIWNEVTGLPKHAGKLNWAMSEAEKELA